MCRLPGGKLLHVVDPIHTVQHECMVTHGTETSDSGGERETSKMKIRDASEWIAVNP
jgi:hypothetical protein